MVTLILIALAAIFNGFMDSILNMWETSIFKDNPLFNQQFWNPTLSWQNKYKNGDRTQEKFLGSTTCFVWLTDAWHLFKVLFQVSVIGAIMLYTPFIPWYFMLASIAAVWGGFFEMTISFLRNDH